MKAVLRYLGAKNRMAKWIVSHFPEHRIYVEPFGGSAAVLLNKEARSVEVYNDVYGRLVNFWRVVRDHGDELARLIELTPYAQDEYAQSFLIADNPIEDARMFAVNSMMSYGGGKGKPGFRRGGTKRNTSCPQSWLAYPDTIRECSVALRSRNIEINNTDAIKIMQTYDSPDTLHYVDPPYLHSTRGSNTRYNHEYTNEDHERLLDYLLTVRGKVVLSGYENSMYESKLVGWRKEKLGVTTTQNTARVEILWIKI